jgi:hypothetical protein
MGLGALRIAAENGVHSKILSEVIHQSYGATR